MWCIEDTQPFSLTPEHQALVTKNWQTYSAWRQPKENARLCRLLAVAGDQITVAHDINYKEVVGLRNNDGKPLLPAPFLVLSALAIVTTNENQLVLLERNSGDWPHSLELPGGFVRATTNKINCDDFITERVSTDLTIPPEEISACNFFQPISHEAILEYMLLYSAQLSKAATAQLAENQSVHIAPPTYSSVTHNDHFSLPLHAPSAFCLAKHESALS